MNLRKIATTAALAVGLSVGATACDSQGYSDYDTMCVNPITQFRMDDYYCQPGNAFYHPAWIYYVHSGYNAPRVGVQVNNYTVNNFHAPSGRVHIQQGGISSTGGKAPSYKAPSKPQGNTGGVTRQQSPKQNAPVYKVPTYKAPSIKIGR